MTNLADLLPAGGGQNNTEFVADGNVSAGAPVVLTAAGKAAPVSESSVAETMGTQAEYGPATTKWLTSTAFDSTNNRAVFAYRNVGTPFYVRCVIGTVNGTGAMTYGTEVVVNSTSDAHQPTVVFDSNAGKVVIFYLEGTPSSNLIGIVGTVDPSDNSISFGSPVTVASDASNGPSGGPLAIFDPTNNEILVIFSDNVDSSSKGQVVSVSGTSLSLGSAGGIGGANDGWFGLTYDSGSNKIIFAFQDYSNSYYASCMVGEISSSAPSFPGLVYAFDSSGISGHVTCSYDSTANKTVFAWRDGGSSNYGKAIVGTVTGATSITFGSEVTFRSDRADYISPIYDPNANKTVIAFQDYNYPSANNFYGRLVVGTVSGTDITFDSPQTFTNSTGASYISAAFDSTSNKVIISYIVTSTERGWGVVFQNASTSTNLTSTNLLGLAPEAISDTATGTINTWGSRCENNDFFGTVSATYGSPTAASAYQSESKVLAYDSANNRFVMAYKDGSNSDYGTAVVGELSGTSITWGTPVVFESATTGSNGLDIAFDSNVNRIVIAYQDQGNSSYGTAIVGSVSGTGSGSTIAFGSPTVFHTAETRYLSMTFDSNDNRIVIVYYDVDRSDYYVTYGIGTVTTGPDAICFNTPALLNGSARTYETSVSFDATENKVLVAYTDDSYDLYVLNLAISGGSGTPGTASSFGVGSPQQRFPRCVYDSVNGKSGVAYAEGTNLPIYFSVISMSGSNVTIETRVLAGDTSDSNYFMHNIAFDASIGQLAICTRDASASKGIAYYGSISGTTSSWTTSGSLFADETILPYGVDVAYDTSANKLAFVYSPSSGSDSAAVVGTLATTTLTIGSDYYVQTNGTLSTTSTSPAQLIGKAIKTNQINIKDYTG